MFKSAKECKNLNYQDFLQKKIEEKKLRFMGNLSY